MKSIEHDHPIFVSDLRIKWRLFTEIIELEHDFFYSSSSEKKKLIKTFKP